MFTVPIPQIKTDAERDEAIKSNESIMICCGRMGPNCIPVFNIMHELESTYPNVQFRAIDFDSAPARAIISLPECSQFMSLPFTVYYRRGELVKATSSIQTKTQIESILKEYFA